MYKSQKLLLINQPWLKDELEALGYFVMTAGVGASRGLDLLIPDTGITLDDLLRQVPERPDRIVFFDDSSTLKILGLERLEIPSIFYSVDAHHHSRWHRYLSSLFDLTLVAQRQHIPEFESQSENIKWFPLWPLRMPVPAKVRQNICVFRGNLNPDLHPERERFFGQLRKIVPIDASLGDWAEPYSNALIVINQTVGGDLNFRNFEALAGGALLITPRLYNGFSELFVEGEDYVCYEEGNAEDAGLKIKYFLEHPSEAIEIAGRARQKLLAKHSSEARALELSTYLADLTPRIKVGVNIGAMLSILPTILSYKYQEKNEKWQVFFDEALRLLNQAIDAKETLSAEYSSAGVFVVLLTLIECQRFSELELVGKKLLEQEKIDPIINVIFIVYSLINQNRSDEALELASGYSDNPSELIHSVPNLLAHVRQLVMSSVSSTN